MNISKRMNVKGREGTAAVLAAENPVLFKNEFCWESDTGILKRGDGVTAYNSLRAFPERQWQPVDNALKAANFDPAEIVVGVNIAANVHLFTRVWVPAGVAITNLHAWFTVAGAVVAGGQMSIYDGTTGARLGVTAVQTVGFQSLGFKSFALTAPIAAQNTGRWVIVSYVVGGSTTTPSLGIRSSLIGPGNAGALIGGPSPRWSYFAAAPPALVGPLNMTVTLDTYPWWAGIS